MKPSTIDETEPALVVACKAAAPEKPARPRSEPFDRIVAVHKVVVRLVDERNAAELPAEAIRLADKSVCDDKKAVVVVVVVVDAAVKSGENRLIFHCWLCNRLDRKSA